MSQTDKEVAKGDTLSQHLAKGDTAFTPAERAELWKAVRKSHVQCHIKGALRALDTLIRLCETEGAHRHFRHALASNDAKGNRMALILLGAQIEILGLWMDTAEEEHEEYLRTELLAYSKRAKANPQ